MLKSLRNIAIDLEETGILNYRPCLSVAVPASSGGHLLHCRPTALLESPRAAISSTFMATVFTKIIEGQIPGTFVWRDEKCVAFMSIAPLRAGHTLVVPIVETDHWIDLPQDLQRHLFDVSGDIGRAIDRAFSPVKVGMMIAGLEVPHTHIHLVPIENVHDLDFANADTEANRDDLESAAESIRQQLREMELPGVTE